MRQCSFQTRERRIDFVKGGLQSAVKGALSCSGITDWLSICQSLIGKSDKAGSVWFSNRTLSKRDEKMGHVTNSYLSWPNQNRNLSTNLRDFFLFLLYIHPLNSLENAIETINYFLQMSWHSECSRIQHFSLWSKTGPTDCLLFDALASFGITQPPQACLLARG